MEMSPKAIAAVTFPVVRKGYDPEQVRSFLSQLSRGVEELQNRALQADPSLAERDDVKELQRQVGIAPERR